MRLLLTSSGISNPSIHGVLVDLLGKPIAESSALFVPTAIYPFPEGPGKVVDGTVEVVSEGHWKLFNP
jgi:dipeptidase E